MVGVLREGQINASVCRSFSFVHPLRHLSSHGTPRCFQRCRGEVQSLARSRQRAFHLCGAGRLLSSWKPKHRSAGIGISWSGRELRWRRRDRFLGGAFAAFPARIEIPVTGCGPTWAEHPSRSAPVFQAAGALARAPSVGTPHEEPRLHTQKNGYHYQVDAHVRTRRASGQLVLGDREGRSRRAQAQAGGKDRRRTDDGGHYVAARFNGPRDAFNHFAQDASFNRGGYRALEDSWAKAIRAGHKVFVDIVPHYTGNSQRPDGIDILYFIDDSRFETYFPNGKGQR